MSLHPKKNRPPLDEPLTGMHQVINLMMVLVHALETWLNNNPDNNGQQPININLNNRSIVVTKILVFPTEITWKYLTKK